LDICNELHKRDDVDVMLLNFEELNEYQFLTENVQRTVIKSHVIPSIRGKDHINIDDCVLVSNQLGNVLTVEHEIDYDRLEVSSPGLDRVLKKEQDFVKFIGERAQIKLRMPVVLENKEPRKNFIGILRGLESGLVQIECDGVIVALPFSDIDRARLSPEF